MHTSVSHACLRTFLSSDAIVNEFIYEVISNSLIWHESSRYNILSFELEAEAAIRDYAENAYLDISVDLDARLIKAHYLWKHQLKEALSSKRNHINSAVIVPEEAAQTQKPVKSVKILDIKI